METTLGFTLFLVALLGMIINSTNLILVLMCLELMLLAVSILFVVITNNHGLLDGQLVVMFVLTVAACESALGLTMMISYYSITGHMSMSLLNLLSG